MCICFNVYTTECANVCMHTRTCVHEPMCMYALCLSVHICMCAYMDTCVYSHVVSLRFQLTLQVFGLLT